MSNSSNKSLYRRQLYVALAMAFPVSAFAAVTPGTGGPNVTQNGGVPVVEIVAPNSGGVSHNRFDTFNVDSQGVVLNNSVNGVKSQLAGQVAGNANLADGAAKVIITEVTGKAASQLNGATEIAGQKAALIMANPNGISANGASFINASRVTLTTGTPQLGEDGSVAKIKVGQGVISVDGNGLDASSADKADLLARSIKLNAELKAKDLRVVTGANEMKYENRVVMSENVTDGVAPTLALDVSKLGGMYADTIAMIGTDKGVGVNVAGTVQALTGQVSLNAQGDVNVAGKMEATKGQLSVTTTQGALNVAKSGELKAQNNLNLTAGTVDNAGTLTATQGNLNALALRSEGSATKFSTTGKLAVGGKASVTGFDDKVVKGTVQTSDGGYLHDERGNSIGPNGQVQGGNNNPNPGSLQPPQGWDPPSRPEIPQRPEGWNPPSQPEIPQWPQGWNPPSQPEIPQRPQELEQELQQQQELLQQFQQEQQKRQQELQLQLQKQQEEQQKRQQELQQQFLQEQQKHQQELEQQLQKQQQEQQKRQQELQLQFQKQQQEQQKRQQEQQSLTPPPPRPTRPSINTGGQISNGENINTGGQHVGTSSVGTSSQILNSVQPPRPPQVSFQPSWKPSQLPNVSTATQNTGPSINTGGNIANGGSVHTGSQSAKRPSINTGGNVVSGGGNVNTGGNTVHGGGEVNTGGQVSHGQDINTGGQQVGVATQSESPTQTARQDHSDSDSKSHQKDEPDSK